MLQLLDLPTVVSQMIAEMVSLTDEVSDFTEGAVLRALLETTGLEVQRQNYALYQGVREGIETGTYKTFGFTRLPATYANGLLTITRALATGPVTLPLSSKFGVPGSAIRIYQTTAVLVLGENVFEAEIPVRCLTAGPEGNTMADTVVEAVDAIPFDAVATNAQPFLNGLAQESDEARRARFRAYIAGLSRGTVVALEAAALSVALLDDEGNALERVTGAYIREPFRENPPEGAHGLVEVYVDNGSGSSSPALLQAVEDAIIGTETIPGVIAAGIDAVIKGVIAVPLDVYAQVTIVQSFTPSVVLDEVTAVLTLYLQGLQVFQPAILAELIAAAMEVDGVADVHFLTPTGNTEVSFDRRITPGLITVVQVV